MRAELDFRESNNCIVTVNMEHALYHELTWNQNADWPHSIVIRLAIENFLRGYLSQYRNPSPSNLFAQPLKHQMSCWLPKSFYDTIAACAKAYDRSVSEVVRAMLRETFWIIENPYGDYLRSKYAEIAAKEPKAYKPFTRP
ncbi:hypothetical protein JNM05_10630 [bacterium]|nr:hypothetical protein [bacterium]